MRAPLQAYEQGARFVVTRAKRHSGEPTKPRAHCGGRCWRLFLNAQRGLPQCRPVILLFWTALLIWYSSSAAAIGLSCSPACLGIYVVHHFRHGGNGHGDKVPGKQTHGLSESATLELRRRTAVRHEGFRSISIGTYLSKKRLI